ncbi:MAG: hypothetical protein H7Y20_14070 [Bryobacteraceae bacterium]|nr:hypothetical protein [Bryobacteraceae bacterium]
MISAPRDELLRQIDNLVGSEILHGSESLCRLLTYLATQSVDRPGVAPKEHQIATEVFHQPDNFDSRLNAIVRVQTGRLRVKLAEYYAGPGAASSMVVQIAKGSYALSLVPNPNLPVTLPIEIAQPPAQSEQIVSLANPSEHALPRAKDWRVPGLSALVALLCLLLVAAVSKREPPAAKTAGPFGDRERPKESAALQTFWKDFLKNSHRSPIVVFSNANFVGRPETGLRYFNPKLDHRETILDHYTGVGEVLAVHELNQVFDFLGKELRVKRSGLLSLDDAKGHDLIFIGSPAENLPLREIPGTQKFLFKRVSRSGPREDLAIVSNTPAAGEVQQFFASPASPIREDYAILGLLPGLGAARKTLILAGTTTLGTEGAAEFVCRNANLVDLLKRLAVPEGGPIPPFEAVLKIGISAGVPVRSDIVAISRRD